MWWKGSKCLPLWLTDIFLTADLTTSRSTWVWAGTHSPEDGLINTNTNTQTPFIHETGMSMGSFLCSPFTHICSAVSSETSVLLHRESSVYHWLNTPLRFTSYMLLTNQDELSINRMPSKPKPHFQENKKRKTKKVHMTSLGWANMDHVTWVLHWLYSTASSHR